MAEPAIIPASDKHTATVSDECFAREMNFNVFFQILFLHGLGDVG